MTFAEFTLLRESNHDASHLAVGTILLALTIVNRTKNSRGYVAALFPLPNLLGCILVLALPWSDKVGLLFALWITGALLHSPCAISL